MSRASLFALIALTLAGVAPNAVAGDETKPWTQILLGKPKLSDPDEVQLTMVAIDGKRDFSPETLYQLSPGKHEFALATTKTGTQGELTYLMFTVDMLPCMTYELVGEQERATSQNNHHWRPMLKSTPKIKRCMKKFGITPSE
jgi:hypothetical protein